MSWKLSLKDSIDLKLLQNFPVDPYSDINIQTASSQLRLSLAYLSIDSGYFSQIKPNTTCIYLKHLPQSALVDVLKALYGGSLQVCSVSGLKQVLKVIEYLDIGEFKKNISRQMLKVHKTCPQNSPLHSIDLLEFCLQYNLIKQFICQIHFSQKLISLENTKNYLQLNKLTPDNLNYLLTKYLAREGSLAYKTINSILENYLSRKSIRPIQYLENEDLLPLKLIWEEYHHKITLNKLSSKTFPNSDTQIPIPQNKVIQSEKWGQKNKNRRFSTNSQNMENVSIGLAILESDQISKQAGLDLKLKSLEKEKEEKDKKIAELQQEIKSLERKLLESKKLVKEKLEDIVLFQNIACFRKSLKENFHTQKNISKNDNLVKCVQNSTSKIKSSRKPSIPLSNKIIF